MPATLDNNLGKSNRAIAAVIAVSIIGAIVRFYHLDAKSFWFDEISLLNGANRSLADIFGYFLIGDLFCQLSTKLAIVIGGISEMSARAPAAIAGALAAPAIYFGWRRIIGERYAAFSAIIIALSFPHIYYSQEARPFTALSIWAALSIGETLRLSERSDKAAAARWLLWMILGINTHFLSAPLFGYELLYLGACTVRADNRSARLKSVAILTGVFLVLAVGSIALFDHMAGDVFHLHQKIPLSPDFGPAGWWALAIKLSGARPVAATLLVGLALVGALFPPRQKRLFFIGAIIVPFVIGSAAAYSRNVNPALRYFLYLLPLLALLASAGVSKISAVLIFIFNTSQKRWAKKNKNPNSGETISRLIPAILAAVFLFIFISENTRAYRQYIDFPAKYNWPADWKSAGADFRGKIGQEDLVVFDPSGANFFSMPMLYRYYLESPGNAAGYAGTGDYSPVIEAAPHTLPDGQFEVDNLGELGPAAADRDIYVIYTFVGPNALYPFDWLKWQDTDYRRRVEEAGRRFAADLKGRAEVNSYFGLAIARVRITEGVRARTKIDEILTPAYSRAMFGLY